MAPQSEARKRFTELLADPAAAMLGVSVAVLGAAIGSALSYWQGGWGETTSVLFTFVAAVGSATTLFASLAQPKRVRAAVGLIANHALLSWITAVLISCFLLAVYYWVLSRTAEIEMIGDVSTSDTRGQPCAGQAKDPVAVAEIRDAANEEVVCLRRPSRPDGRRVVTGRFRRAEATSG